jgi:hypothetical protein
MQPTSEQQLFDSHENLACPFCLSQCIHAESGKTRCPVCDATFEIYDRGECVFGDTDNIRLPAVGIICASCGLIQAGEYQHCLYCGEEVNTTVQ